MKKIKRVSEIFKGEMKDEREQQINNEIYADALSKICLVLEIFLIILVSIINDMIVLLVIDLMFCLISFICLRANIKSIKNNVLGNSVKKETFYFGGYFIPLLMSLIYSIICLVFKNSPMINIISDIVYIIVTTLFIVYFFTINCIYKRAYNRSK